MKTIIANLKLYINLNSWFFAMMLIILIFFNIQVASDQKANEQLVVGSFMTLPFILGFIASIVLIDVMNKPFSFCLPGHRQNVKKILMIMAVFVGFFFTFLMCFFILNRLQFNCFISIFFATLVSFLIGAELYMFARSLCALLFMLSFFLFTYHLPLIILGRFILQHHLILLCIGLGSSIISWQLLNSSGLARRFCDNPKWMGFFDFRNKEKLLRLHRFNAESQKEKSKLKINPSVERFFLDKMNRQKYFSIGKYIWGCLYQAFGVSFSNFNPVSFLFLILFILVFCYFSYYSWWMFFMIPLMMAMSFWMPVYSNILISDGRKERFYSTLVLNAAITFLLIMIMLAAIISSKVAGLFLPDLELPGKTLVFNTMSFKYAMLPFVVVPIASIFRLIFHNSTALAIGSMVFCYTLYITLFGAYGFIKNSMSLNNTPQIVNQYSIIYLVIVWIIFIGVLRHICFKRSLI